MWIEHIILRRNFILKKVLASIAIASLALAACSNEAVNDADNKEPIVAKTDPAQQKFVTFQMELTDLINENDQPIEALYALENAEEAPSAEEMATAKTEAKTAAETLYNTLSEMGVPEDLSEVEEEIKASLADIAMSYQTQAKHFEDGSDPEYKQTMEQFEKGNEAFGAIAEELDLSKPDLGKQINR